MAGRIRILPLLATAACALHVIARAQMPPPIYDREAYLAPLVKAERMAADLPPAAWQWPRTPELSAAVRKSVSALQQLSLQRSFAGDTEGAIAVSDVLLPDFATSMPDAPARLAALADAHAEDAIAAIVAQARTRRVVILNEAHHVPMHRAFAMRLAAALRRIGYSYLAVEDFSAADGNMSALAPGYVTMSSGYHQKEAVFAGFINAALADGWKPVAYDVSKPAKPGQHPRERLKEREQIQADNLAARIFARDANARVFIYVGYAHVYKTRPGTSGDIDWMAERLRRATGLGILSVDQTQFYAHPRPGAEHPLYAGLLAKFPSSEPIVLRMPDGSHAVFGDSAGRDDLRGRVDMQVVFPRYAVHDGRPDWLRMLAGRSPRPIPAELLPKQGRRVIKAFRVDAAQDAVPADVVLLEAGKPVPTLMLPTGEYRYAIEE